MTVSSTTSTNTGIKGFSPLIVIFFGLNALFFATSSLLTQYSISLKVLLIGNLILFIATAVSYYFYSKSLSNERPMAMVRMIYVGMFVKLGLCLLSSFLYIMIAGKQVNKGGIIGCMIVYLVYTVTEVVILQKASKRKKHG